MGVMRTARVRAVLDARAGSSARGAVRVGVAADAAAASVGTASTRSVVRIFTALEYRDPAAAATAAASETARSSDPSHSWD